MNTNTVAKKLGVSTSTIARWVKQLNLNVERNEFGHFLFSESDVLMLKAHQEKLQEQIPAPNVAKPKRTGATNLTSDKEWVKKIELLERKIDGKADRVVSYQLLQHRQELEDIRKELAEIQEMLEEISIKMKLQEETKATNQNLVEKKKTPIRAFFGW